MPIEQLRHAVAAFRTLSEVWLELILAYDAEQVGHADRHEGEQT